MRISDLSSDVCSSDLRLHLEDESGNGGVARLHDARGRGLLARRRRELGKRVDELLDAEILQRRTEKDGCQIAVPIGGGVERGIARQCKLRLDRNSGVWGQSGSGSVERGGGGKMNKKNRDM